MADAPLAWQPRGSTPLSEERHTHPTAPSPPRAHAGGVQERDAMSQLLWQNA